MLPKGKASNEDSTNGLQYARGERKSTEPGQGAYRHLANHAWLIALCLILALAAWLRLDGLGDSSLWLDECYTASFSQGTFWDAAETCWKDVHPPLFFFVTIVSERLGDRSETVLRLPSALFGIATCLATFLLAKTIVGRKFALLAALLIAVCPLAIDHSREARMYGIVTFAAAMLTVAVLRLAQRPTTRRSVMVIAYGTALVYTHYVGLIYVFSLTLGAILFSGFTRKAKTTIVKASLAILILFSPWVPALISQLGHRQPHLGRFSLLSLQDMFWAHGPFSSINSQSLASLAGALFALLVALSVIAPFARRSGLPESEHARKMLHSLAGTFLVFVGTYYVVGLWRPSFWPKTALVVYPVLMTLSAAGADAISKSLTAHRSGRAAFRIFLVVCVALALLNAAQYEPPVHPDIRSLFAFLQARPQSEPVLFCRNDAAPMADFYLPNAAKMYYSERIMFVHDVMSFPSKLRHLRKARQFWLANTRPGWTPLQGLAATHLERISAVQFDRCSAILYTWPEENK